MANCVNNSLLSSREEKKVDGRGNDRFLPRRAGTDNISPCTCSGTECLSLKGYIRHFRNAQFSKDDEYGMFLRIIDAKSSTSSCY